MKRRQEDLAGYVDDSPYGTSQDIKIQGLHIEVMRVKNELDRFKVALGELAELHGIRDNYAASDGRFDADLLARDLRALSDRMETWVIRDRLGIPRRIDWKHPRGDRA